MTRSAEWWAGWQEAIEFACRSVCRGCADVLPVDPGHPGRYHKVSEGAWSHCSAVHIREAAERERQAALETRGWSGVEGGKQCSNCIHPAEDHNGCTHCECPCVMTDQGPKNV